MLTNIRFLKYWTIVIVLLLPAQLFAISMHCASVGAAGDVTVCWDRNGTGSGNFRSWYLYHSTNAAGPFNTIDSLLLYSDTTKDDLNANASVNPAYYYVTFKSNDGSPDIFSDTIRAIGLNVNNPGSGFANLSWNPTHNPLIGTNYPYYLIYKEYPSGIFTLIDSIDARSAPVPMTYSDTITICDDTIKYRIEVKDSSGCISISSLKGDRFFDLQAPAIPILDSVSVDIFGNATVTWQVSTSSDTRSYIILQNPGPVALDTVVGHNLTTDYTIIGATGSSKSFIVIAVDSCNNRSAPSLPHSTIFLKVGFDLCTKSAGLNWTPYNFWGTSPLYNIFVSVNGASETLIGTTTQTNFNDTNLVSGAGFCYRVQAAETGGIRTSTSNRVCITPNFPPPPAFSYIRKVTVIGTDQVYILAYVDSLPTVTGYKLFRSLSSSGPFTLVNSVNVTGVSTISFLDNVPTDKGPYYYKVTTIDSCGITVLSSQISNTILLSGNANPDFTNSLSWTDYSDWPMGVAHYNIYVITNGIVNTIPVATISSAPLTYINSVIDNYFSDGKFCYIIEAIETPGNPNLFIDSSRSNELCLTQSPIIFIPNAFHPGGLFNEVFFSSNAFVSSIDYSLDIYNRWGENIFHTNDPHAGWNGKTNGKSAPEAIYIYRLRVKNADGNDMVKTGSVTLIR